MKRLAVFLLVAGIAPAGRAADLTPPAAPLPTSPQVPPPEIDQTGGVVPASGVSRALAPVRQRVLYVSHSPDAVAQPLPTGYAAAGGSCAGPDCGSSRGGNARSCLAQIKAWLCFQPTTGDALPHCRPLPYVGPITGTFRCTSGVGCGSGGGCGNASGCESGGCAADAQTDGRRNGGLAVRFGSLLPGRGCKGECVPPADDAVAGYRFAPTQNPAALGHALPVAQTVHTTYKPAQGQTGPSSAARPAVDPLSRPFTRP